MPRMAHTAGLPAAKTEQLRNDTTTSGSTPGHGMLLTSPLYSESKSNGSWMKNRGIHSHFMLQMASSLGDIVACHA